MAISHVQFDDQTQHGRILRRALSQLEDGLDLLNKIRDTMTMMVDGDGSQAAMFTEVVTRFGFANTTNAKAAWDELNSLLFKFNTDADVTFVHAATVQALSKFR